MRSEDRQHPESANEVLEADNTADPVHSSELSPDPRVIEIGAGGIWLGFVALALLCGLAFVIGFLQGRGLSNKGKPLAAAVPSKRAPPKKLFLDPECGIPFNLRIVSGSEDRDAHSLPSDEQMARLRPLLPKFTRIHDRLRVDANPPLVFVLHQPDPRKSRATELSMFVFKSGGIEKEDLGSFCFIPDFLVDADGRAIGAWSENPTGGNAWSCSSLTTMVVERGEISHPEIRSEFHLVAEDLFMDEGVPVLLMLDTRYEFYAGLCHACSPIRREVFRLNGKGEWVAATSSHRRLLSTWIQEDIEELEEVSSKDDTSAIATAALNLYLDAETAGLASRYRGRVKAALLGAGWGALANRIDEANRRKCRLDELESD